MKIERLATDYASDGKTFLLSLVRNYTDALRQAGAGNETVRGRVAELLARLREHLDSDELRDFIDNTTRFPHNYR